MVWLVGRFIAVNLFAGFFCKKYQPDGWEGRSVLSFEGSLLDVCEMCDRKKGLY